MTTAGVFEAGAVPDARGQNLYRADPEAEGIFARTCPGLFAHLAPHFDRLGAMAGGQLDELAVTADRNPPTLSVRSRAGEDESRVLKHPGYVEMERLAFGEFGLAAMSHRGGVLGWPEPMPPAAKYALTYLFVQAEFGLCCPMSMTDSLARTLRRFGDESLVERFLPMLTSPDFDALYQGAMFMTEQGAGSDVAATTTAATAQPDGSWALHGDKWFCSNPDAGLAMVLARSEPVAGAPGHLAVPAAAPAARRHAQPLPDPAAEGQARHALDGQRRDPARGRARLPRRRAGPGLPADGRHDQQLAPVQRRAGGRADAPRLTEAMFVARHRQAFGRRLMELPLMRRQLLKLAVRTEQARTMAFQTARALARADRGDADGAALARIMTPLIKFRACRDARRVTGDAMEVRGGCGYIEEWSDPRRVRDAHLGSIWEGTSNIVALDVLRAIRRDGALPVLRARVDALLADGEPCDARLADLQSRTVERAFALAAHAAGQDRDELARQAASALYHVTTMAGLRWEARHAGLPARARLADACSRIGSRRATRSPPTGAPGTTVPTAPRRPPR